MNKTILSVRTPRLQSQRRFFILTLSPCMEDFWSAGLHSNQSATNPRIICYVLSVATVQTQHWFIYSESL